MTAGKPRPDDQVQAAVLMDTIQHMAEYLGGPGLPGFCEWIAAQTVNLHMNTPVDPADIQDKMFTLAARFGSEIAEIERAIAPAADMPPGMTVTVSSEIDASLAINFRREGNGLLGTLLSSGHYSGPVLDNRFFSIGQLPPDEITPAEFWGSLLVSIGTLLETDDDT